MAESLIISVSGMRGVIGENLTPVIAAQYGCAFGTFLKRRRRGGRPSAASLHRTGFPRQRPDAPVGHDGRAVLRSEWTSIDLGLVTTPCVGIMLRELGCDGGIVITASHNPLPYNGIKLLLGNGMAPPPATAAADQAGIPRRAGPAIVDSVHCGTVSRNEETDRVHIEKVLATVEAGADRGQAISDRSRQRQRRRSESRQEAPGRVGLRGHRHERRADRPVRPRSRADRGQPGRSVPAGRSRRRRTWGSPRTRTRTGWPSSMRTASTSARSTRWPWRPSTSSPRSGGTAAANLSTSRMIDDIADGRAARVIRTPVGEANVADAMIEHGCVIGGEGNGGVIDLRVGPDPRQPRRDGAGPAIDGRDGQEHQRPGRGDRRLLHAQGQVRRRFAAGPARS